MKNVILNNSEINSEVLHFIGTEASLDANDYICIDNVTINSSAANELSINTGNPVTAYATLTSQCP